MLKAREPDVKTVLDEEPELVGLEGQEVRRQRRRGDLHADRLRRDAPRRAHRRANVDLINDPPPQDVPQLAQTPGIKVHRGRREAHRVHRHGPGARRAPVLERQGQEPVQGQARAPGALPGDRHRRDQQVDDARAVEADRRRCLPSPRARRRPRSRSGCRSTRTAAKKLLADAGYPNGFEVHARLPEQPLRQRREDLPGARRDVGADRRRHASRQRDAARAVLPEAREDRHQHVHAGLGRRVDRRDLHAAAGAVDATTARATATSTTAATRTRSSTSSRRRSRSR